ncbi:hypothetical protein DAPPUDRAFT_330601 [Daphnia pulex]|uniref:Transposable element P transposase-like GTP-binding insertion domain-containing protein n=1 Tax=Daphnia pulex TaxID=6669 RepID=E9HK26_DAPPU|nr:hypothetical protein DAPPUDRAFT_330601 [Daphnia pulex]|eukprot:EFX67920.1 hypothetical protein DAPPUDRAFT_330601 [Daphnia pulex]
MPSHKCILEQDFKAVKIGMKKQLESYKKRHDTEKPGAQELNSNSEPMEVMYSLIELEEDSEPIEATTSFIVSNEDVTTLPVAEANNLVVLPIENLDISKEETETVVSLENNERQTITNSNVAVKLSKLKDDVVNLSANQLDEKVKHLTYGYAGTAARFIYYERLHKLEKKNHFRRAHHKLTDSHINPTNFEKMNVAKAAQLLSDTVAHNIRR